MNQMTQIAETPKKRTISLSQIWSVLWSSRLIIVITTVTGLLLGMAWSIYVGPQYTIVATLIPTESDTENNGLLGQLPGFLKSGEGEPVPKFSQFQTAIFSIGVASLMNKQYATLCEIRKSRCDQVTHVWQPQPGWRRSIDNAIAAILGEPPPPAIPQDEDLASFISGKLTIASPKTSTVTLTMTYGDAEAGKRFLGHLIAATNDYLKKKDRVSLSQYVEYLSNRLDHMSSVGQRDSSPIFW